MLVSSRSGEEDYGDDAIGNVQLLLRDGLCEIAARITSERRGTIKPYNVIAIISESEEKILNAKCQDCTAAQEPCKHGLLLWGGWTDAVLINQLPQ